MSLRAYNVKDVLQGYRFWKNALLEKVITMFDYHNLPTGVTQDIVERYMMLNGYVVWIDIKPYGLMAIHGNLFGQQLSPHKLPTQVMISNPALPPQPRPFDIGKDCTVVYHSHTDKFVHRGFSELIKRYARIIADIESSISSTTINSRHSYLFTANSGTVAQSIKSTMEKIEIGESDVVNINNILGKAEALPLSDGRVNQLGNLTDLREKMLSAFLTEIGVNTVHEKREHLITKELEDSSHSIVVNIQSMIEQRKKGIAKVNALFGTDISVELSKDTYDKNIRGV